MFEGTYRFAGVTVHLQTLHRQVHDLCEAYASREPANLVITTTQADIDYEREKADRACGDGYLETLAVYRLLAEALVEKNILLLHGSAVAVDGRGYLFTAKSGTGKSTHTRLWRQLLGERAVMVNDDKPLVAVTDNGAWVYGTPWDGKHRLSTDLAVRLSGICLLRRGMTNDIQSISPQEAYPALLGQILRPREPAALARMLALAEELTRQTPLYAMACTMELEAAQLAYETMRGAAR